MSDVGGYISLTLLDNRREIFSKMLDLDKAFVIKRDSFLYLFLIN